MTPFVVLTDPVATESRAHLQRVMWERVSLRRDAEGLTGAQETLRALAGGAAVDPETANLLLVAQLVVAAALARTESRGGHYRAGLSRPRCGARWASHAADSWRALQPVARRRKRRCPMSEQTTASTRSSIPS